MESVWVSVRVVLWSVWGYTDVTRIRAECDWESVYPQCNWCGWDLQGVLWAPKAPAVERLPGPSSSGDIHCLDISSSGFPSLWWGLGWEQHTCQSMCSVTRRPQLPYWQDSCTWPQSGRSHGGHADGGPDSGAWHLEARLWHGMWPMARALQMCHSWSWALWGLQQVWVTTFIPFRPIHHLLKQPVIPLKSATLPMERGNKQFLCPDFMPLSVFCPGSWPFQKEKQGKKGDRKARKWPGSWQTYSVKDKIVNILGSVGH